MTYIQCTPTQPHLIAVSKLEKSPLNARRTAAKVGMEELKASLLAHGLMQNLVVTDTGDGTYRVIAGGRRLEAIHSLQAEGKLPDRKHHIQQIGEAVVQRMRAAAGRERAPAARMCGVG